MEGMFKGKRFVLMGVANQKSIAWAIAQALHAEGAELAFSYVNEAIEKRWRPLAEGLGSKVILPCDVQSDEEIANFFAEIESRWGRFDGLLHSIAFADKTDLDNPFIQTTRDGFKLALEVSAFSLIAVSKAAAPLMNDGGSVVTMTYMGSERVVPHYNVMGVAKAALESSVRYLAPDLGERGIRVNAISAGPIKTLAAAGIPKFRELLAQFAETAPLKRNVSLEDVAQSTLYLLSPMSSGVTGEVHYVDCGFNVMGL